MLFWGGGTWRYHRRMAIPSGAVVRARLRPAAALFRSLGDPARLEILRSLAVAPARVTDLVERLGLAQATVSAHLGCLRDCGLVSVQAVGRSSVYRLAPAVEPAVLALFAAGEQVLEATGDAVALCPTYGDTTAEQS